MKVIITITQNVTSVKNQLSSKFNGTGSITEAGPFKTEAEAQNWKEFMMNRRDNYEEMQFQSSVASEAYWFGITMEGQTIQ